MHLQSISGRLLLMGMTIGIIAIVCGSALLVPYHTSIESINRRDGTAHIRSVYCGLFTVRDTPYWDPIRWAGYAELRAPDEELVLRKRAERFPWSDQVSVMIDARKADEAKLLLRLLSINRLIEGREQGEWKVGDEQVVEIIREHINLWNDWAGGILEELTNRIIRNIDRLEGR